MIAWLEGKIIEYLDTGIRKILIIVCCGVGYEVQLLTRHKCLIPPVEKYALWIHQLQKEDSTILYGFETKVERDLFRKLIAVNGIGAKIAMSLLDNSKPQELVQSIINQNIDDLIKSPGIGRRMAEKLCLELKNKLKGFYEIDSYKFSNESENKASSTKSDILPLQSELEETLLSLEYEQAEINNTISLIFKEQQTDNSLSKKGSIKEEHFEAMLKRALVLLSQDHS
tara:strand:- start:3778 stop:4458 length:681 start_codon:yes stop_codon:yes gene_type:complete